MSVLEDIAKEMALALLAKRLNWVFDYFSARMMKSVTKVSPEVAKLVAADLKRKRQKEIARFIRRLERKL